MATISRLSDQFQGYRNRFLTTVSNQYLLRASGTLQGGHTTCNLGAEFRRSGGKFVANATSSLFAKHPVKDFFHGRHRHVLRGRHRRPQVNDRRIIHILQNL